MPVLKVEEESPTRTALEIEVPAEEVEETRRGMTRAYAKQAAIPGFRKGHAPESVVQKRFAEQIREDVIERTIPDALAGAIEERKLAVLGRPRVESLTWEPPGPICFTARLDI